MRAHNVFDPKYRAIIELAVASMTICKNGFTHSFPRQQRRRARFKEIKHRLGTCLFCICGVWPIEGFFRSEEHTSELQSLMRISYAVFCLKKKNKYRHQDVHYIHTRVIHP